MKTSRIVFIITFIVLIATGLFAGPTIIRDSRVSDTAITPVLGRGYSVGTNTFQSTCMDNIAVTEPSYDFTYTFESLDETTTTKSQREQSGTSFAWPRAYRDVYKSMIAKVGKNKSKSATELKTYIVKVTVNLHSYYASIDESKSQMSESARKLLAKNDLAAFFSSCGPYYVRSIGRHAVFESFFEYKTASTTRETSFEGRLEEQIKGFRTTYRYLGWGRSEVRTEQYTQAVRQDPLTESFNKEASEKQLTITTMAYGLGKNKEATLISYDIDTFKGAIKDAFLSMQDTNTGKVEQIEAVPWVENVAFQNELNMQDEDTYADVLDKDGKAIPVMDKDGKAVLNPDGSAKTQQRKLMLYEKKLLLNENGEFIIEIDRADRNIMNMYYKAKLCRQNINNWKARDAGGKYTELKPDYAKASVQNNKDISKTIPLTQLDSTLSDDKITKIFNTHTEFMYGAAGGAGGASACMRDIMQQGIFKISYRNIPACQPVIQHMGEILDDEIDQYCMPQLAD